VTIGFAPPCRGSGDVPSGVSQCGGVVVLGDDVPGTGRKGGHGDQSSAAARIYDDKVPAVDHGGR
jgi:hypothetical protein